MQANKGTMGHPMQEEKDPQLQQEEEGKDSMLDRLMTSERERTRSLVMEAHFLGLLELGLKDTIPSQGFNSNLMVRITEPLHLEDNQPTDNRSLQWEDINLQTRVTHLTALHRCLEV